MELSRQDYLKHCHSPSWNEPAIRRRLDSYVRFDNARRALGIDSRQCLLAFHYTHVSNVESIWATGFDPTMFGSTTFCSSCSAEYGRDVCFFIPELKLFNLHGHHDDRAVVIVAVLPGAHLLRPVSCIQCAPCNHYQEMYVCKTPAWDGPLHSQRSFAFPLGVLYHVSPSLSNPVPPLAPLPRPFSRTSHFS